MPTSTTANGAYSGPLLHPVNPVFSADLYAALQSESIKSKNRAGLNNMDYNGSSPHPPPPPPTSPVSWSRRR